MKKVTYAPMTPEQIQAADEARKLKIFKSAQTSRSVDKVLEQIGGMLKWFAVQFEGCKDVRLQLDPDGVSLEVEKAFAVGCTIYVRTKYDWDASKILGQEDGKPVAYRPVTFTTQLSWSGTTRSVSQALTSVKLYQQFVEIAAEIETVVEDGSTIMHRLEM